MMFLDLLQIPMPDKIPDTAAATINYLVIALTVAMLSGGWLILTFIKTFMSDTLTTYRRESEENRNHHKENMKELGQAHNAAIDRLCATFETTIDKVTHTYDRDDPRRSRETA